MRPHKIATRLAVSATIVTALLLLGGSQAHAVSVFLNGVKIDGATNQTFEGCTVRLDAAGNVYIEAKAYDVHASQSGTPTIDPAKIGGPVTQRYWLVTEKSQPGATGYDIDVFINGKWVRKFMAREGHVVLEISTHLKVGPNKVQFVARKVQAAPTTAAPAAQPAPPTASAAPTTPLGAAGAEATPEEFFRIIIGQGDSGGREVLINRKLLEYKRTGSDTQNFNDQLAVTAE